ncbi:ubiquinone biosynthesis protein, putative [Pediculus humanus corporis]|uniref:Ubiquinone biosynthesis protein, putative n=1 Tax=Pediculus humanus subsp. corporis TaxID=121224 RepID=E0VT27_PEDHC|nr:ubiquinone biosynthesis protein, putative [Pediculus humanus corporis]EEB16533.1 ubiquinone biosynthesis protein, putative [Pediculus humanus corporis]
MTCRFTRSYSTKVTCNIDSAFDEKIKENYSNSKKHSGIMSLKCTSIPEPILKGIYSVLEKKDVKTLVSDGEILSRYLTQRLPPPEKSEKRKKKEEIIDSMKNNTNFQTLSNDVITKYAKKILKNQLYNWKPITYNKNLALQYLVMRSPAEFGVLCRVFNEIYLRDKNFAPKRLFDFGSGVGTTVWAANEYWKESMKEYYCVDSSMEMHKLAELVLQNNDPYSLPMIKNVYYRQFLPATCIPSDIVVSSFSLFESSSCLERLKLLTTLWNNTLEYLVLIENGSFAGYSLLNEARTFILEISEKFNVKCYIFAPCPHELTCPRFEATEKSIPCNFSIKYKHLNVYKYRNSTENHKFSFLIFKKGEDSPMENRSPRIVKEVLLRRNHVVCNVCTSKGQLKTLVSTKNQHGSSAYKCLKHSKWGDLIPEGISFDFIEEEKLNEENYEEKDE